MKVLTSKIVSYTSLACLGLCLIGCSDPSDQSSVIKKDEKSAGTVKAISQPELRTLTEQNLIDIIIGSCIQSTRNCDPSESLTEVKAALAEGKVFQTIKTRDVSDDGMVVAVQGIGGGGPWQYVIDRTTEQGLETIEDPRREVIKLFESFVQKDVAALVRSEAAGATAAALLLSAEMGIPTLDGGITGRAVP